MEFLLDALLTSKFLRRSRAGVRHALKDSSVAGLARDPRLLRIACLILGPHSFPFHATFFEKSWSANWLVNWHQDRSLPLKSRAEADGWGPWSQKGGTLYALAPATALQHVAALRIHLDASAEENGPLRIIPGTHRLGVLSDAKIAEITAQASPLECPVPRGGVLAMSPLLLHSSSKSRSRDPRRVLHIEYSAWTSFGDNLELACPEVSTLPIAKGNSTEL